jgi:ABC-type nitrate/sulfonate/bicarbonate transport system substrate-binding protein
MMIKKTAVAASVVTIAAVFWIATQIRTPAPLPPEKVKFGLAMQESSGLAMIANAKGFFAAENLEVDITPYASGKRALEEGLFGSREEIVTTAEVPIALGSFERSDFRVVASINETDNFSRIVGNKQEGVLTPSDLRGKKLGIQPISATHFFLHLFLLEHGIDETEVNFIYLKSEELPDALKEGKVAAASLREPQLTLTKQKLGSDAAVFFSEGLYTQFEALVANERLIRERPEVITRFLKALLNRLRISIRRKPVRSSPALWISNRSRSKPLTDREPQRVPYSSPRRRSEMDQGIEDGPQPKSHERSDRLPFPRED